MAANKRRWRAGLGEERARAERDRDARSKARKREEMSVEARNAERERDRLRKARKRAAEREGEKKKGNRKTDISSLLNPG